MMASCNKFSTERSSLQTTQLDVSSSYVGKVHFDKSKCYHLQFKTTSTNIDSYIYVSPMDKARNNQHNLKTNRRNPKRDKYEIKPDLWIRIPQQEQESHIQYCPLVSNVFTSLSHQTLFNYRWDKTS